MSTGLTPTAYEAPGRGRHLKPDGEPPDLSIVQLGRVLPLLLVLLASTQSLAAPRDRDKDRARDFARQGNTAYNLGQFDEAARQYEKAYRLVQDPNLLFNVAQSYRLANQPEQALAAYKGFLRTAPSDHPKRPQAREHLAELEASREQGGTPGPSAPPPSQAGAPGTVASAAPGDGNNDFNPFATAQADAGAEEDAAGADDGEVTSDNLIRRTNPTGGGLLMLADQAGVTGGTVSHFQVFVRAKHQGRKYEGGYFHLPIFAPNPEYTTSAFYFRFTSATNWWAQLGALGKDGNYHLGGGIEWPYLSMAARLENVGGRDLCSAKGESATYVVPEAAVRVPVITGIRIGVLGSFRQALFTSDDCVFHPSMANVDGEIDWAWGEALVLRGGLGVYQFFGLGDATATGPWASYEEKTAPHAFLGARYQWKKHISLLANYRRFFYAGGLNQLVFAIEASLGEL